MRILKGIGLVVLVIAVVAVAAFVWANVRTDVGKDMYAQTAASPGFEATPELLKAGEYVARAGDCVACHSVPGEPAFTGGLKMGTPLGAIYTTNITPDPETGIGNYSFGEFVRAVREGVARDGRRLYPAMPYPSYVKVTDDDMKALYVYFTKGVAPARLANRASEIPSPYNMRWPLALWNVVFVDSRVYRPKSEHDEAWNRGAYLVQGLGHCGSCHTRRGFAFQEAALDERGSGYLGGALLDAWYAPSLRGEQNVGLGRWSVEDTAAFLRDGHNAHAAVYGSMIDAYNNSTQFLTDGDLTAVATFLKSLPGAKDDASAYAGQPASTPQATKVVDTSVPGADIFLKQCSFCHGRDGEGHGSLLPPLAGNPTVLDADPSSLLNVVLNGAGRVVSHGMPDSYRMTPFRVLLRDQQIADVINYVRSSWGNHAQPTSAAAVGAMRIATDPSSDHVIVLKMR